MTKRKLGVLTFEVFEFGADLFLCEGFKLLMNLTCVRKNRWNKSQLLLGCNLSVFSHFLIEPNLKRSLHRLVAGPRLTIHTC